MEKQTMKYIVIQIAPWLEVDDCIRQSPFLTGQGVLVPVACDGFYRDKEDAHDIAVFMSESFPNLQTIVAEVLVADKDDEVTVKYPPLPSP